MRSYDHQQIEPKWQRAWETLRLHEARDGDPRPKWYGLVEFPYPSGDGLHTGHPRPYIGMDIIARKRRMEGRNVLFPFGWDAFGLPTENYALKIGIHPREATARNIATFKRQVQALGLSFDWSREVNTTDPGYYRWTQWIFLQFLKHGLAYKATQPINWCLSCKIGLANEEVVQGRCERCGGPVELRDKQQWMLRITAYADHLLSGLDTVDYIERAKVQQRHWIGRSEGATIRFPMADGRWSISVFTTRPDTLFGVTYLVLAPEHPFVEALLSVSSSRAKREISQDGNTVLILANVDEVRAYVTAARRKSHIERAVEEQDKTGVELKGVAAINPANGEEIPVWVADYVLGHYGTGAIMAVPAHDERDFAFVRKYGLPLRQVIHAAHPSYLVIEKSLPSERVGELSAFGSIAVEKEGQNWGKFFRVTVDAAREQMFIHFLETHLLKTSDDGGSWYADSCGTTNVIVLPGKQFHVWDRASFEAFKQYGRSVGIPEEQLDADARPYIGDGTLVNSGKFTGMRSEDAKQAITEHVGGEMTVTYKLRDWVFSRQRYWGEPIPVVFCAGCASSFRHSERSEESHPLASPARAVPTSDGVRSVAPFHSAQDDNGLVAQIDGVPHAIIPVPEDQLPVELPEVERYQPTDTGESPLASIETWVNTTCPQCGGPAKRETDVMPNWAGSSWYFLRYCDPKNEHALADREKLEYWMPVDWYNGGMEHTTLHLLYSRFWYQFLYDIAAVPQFFSERSESTNAREEGLCPTLREERASDLGGGKGVLRETGRFPAAREPYAKRTSHGLILAEGGAKMSKSKGNVVNPDAIIAEYGADAFRVYEMFMGPFDQAIAWSTRGVVGARRFLERVAELLARVDEKPAGATGSEVEEPDLARLMHRTIQKVTEDIEAMRFNTAVSGLMEYTNALQERERIPFAAYTALLTLLAPFAPHLAEELHAKLPDREATEHSIFHHPWPTYDPRAVVADTVTVVVQVNGKVRATLNVPVGATEDDVRSRALALENVAKHLAGPPSKMIVVPGKLINFVA